VSAPDTVGRPAVPDTLAIATRNPGKVREIRDIFGSLAVAWLSDEGRWPEVHETGATYLENALLKARAVAVAAGVPALADDSGIEVDALGGEPGVRSARLAGEGATDQENLRLLIELIRDTPAERRTARYRCVAVCAWPDGAEVWTEGTCDGLLQVEPRGSGGFGYDPIFVPRQEWPPDGRGRTMAELTPEEKHAISHRGKAFRLLAERLGASPI